MVRVVSMITLPLLLAAAPVPVAPPLDITTAQPLDDIQACFRSELADSGRLTAINTAAGVMLDFAFDAVGPDGKVAVSHVAFSIEDQGTQRRVSATAANGADGLLATQMLRHTLRRCIPDAPTH